jgi:pyruvate formate lyase activating enzyme
MTLTIKGWNETSLLDWDGKIVTTLYVGGCNFRCPFCHNFQLVESPDSLPTISVETIEAYLLAHRDFIDGICLTGGEPCLYKKSGLLDFLQQIKELGFLIKLDTNGADPDCLAVLCQQKLVDYLAMDIKAPLDKTYEKLTAVTIDLQKISASIKLIINSGIAYEFRTTVVPPWIGEKEISAIAKSITGASSWVLQQFVPANCWAEDLRRQQPYSEPEFNHLVAAAQLILPTTRVRGI